MRLSNERIAIEDFRAKSLDVETNRRFAIRNGFFAGVSFTNNYAFEAERICHITIRVLLHYRLPRLHGAKLPCWLNG
jgi:hypothetical protein